MLRILDQKLEVVVFVCGGGNYTSKYSGSAGFRGIIGLLCSCRRRSGEQVQNEG